MKEGNLESLPRVKIDIEDGAGRAITFRRQPCKDKNTDVAAKQTLWKMSENSIQHMLAVIITLDLCHQQGGCWMTLFTHHIL